MQVGFPKAKHAAAPAEVSGAAGRMQDHVQETGVVGQMKAVGAALLEVLMADGEGRIVE